MALAVNLALTTAGQVLMAKIQAGAGTVPLTITRVMTASGESDDPLNLDALVDEKQQFEILESNVIDVHTNIKALLTNTGLAMGYSLSQIGFYAEDPDEGEVLYRISQFEQPNYVPAPNERPWTYAPDFNFWVGNASVVNITISPAGLVTREQLDAEVNRAQSTETLLANAITDLERNNAGGYCVCGTDGATAAKTAYVDSGFELSYGAMVRVTFTEDNTAERPTLNISDTGDYPVYYRGGKIAPGILAAGATLAFSYDGAVWNYTGEANNNPHFEVLTEAELVAGLATDPRVVNALNLLSGIQAIAQAVIDANGNGDLMDTISKLLADMADALSRISIMEWLYGNGSGVVTEFDVGDLIIIANQGTVSGGKVVI